MLEIKRHWPFVAFVNSFGQRKCLIFWKVLAFVCISKIFCLLWICIFLKAIWYKCKYQSCFQLFYPVLIREIFQKHFWLKCNWLLRYITKYICICQNWISVKWYHLIKYCGSPKLCKPYLRHRRIRRISLVNLGRERHKQSNYKT